MKKLILLILIAASCTSEGARPRRKSVTLTSKTKMDTQVYAVGTSNPCNWVEKLKGKTPESIKSLEKECGIQYLGHLANKEDVMEIPINFNSMYVDSIILSNIHGSIICPVKNERLVVYTGGKSQTLKKFTGFSAGTKIMCGNKSDYSSLIEKSEVA